MWSFFIQFIKILQLKEYILYLIFIPWTIAQSSNCLSGCKCSINSNDGNGFNTIAVICCLINQTRLSHLVGNDYPFDIKHCGYDLINHHYDPIHNKMIIWPNHTLCLSLWRQLKIQLTENSWPSLISSSHSKLHIQSKCMIELERLAIVGQLNVYDGFIQLDTNQFRNHIFPTTTTTSTTTRTISNDGGALKLRRFTIEQTSLHSISQGFFDEIGANHLIDLEIRRNINLTEHGLGIGWLANLKHLQSLDLSLNHLYQINLASWGLPKHYSSLHNLDLSGNYLIHLKDQTFIRLPNLIYLNLANNYLTTLSLNVFQGLSHLKVLDLQGNQLRMYSLIVTMPNLNIILPQLKQLILSRNPLAVIPTSNVISNISNHSSSSLKWWFTNSCPKLMTTLYLENIGLVKYNRNQSNSLQLPIINWEYCNSLTDIYLTYNDDWLKCIDHQWLNGINNGSNVHPKFRIHPSTLELCPNHNVMVTKSDQLTNAISSTTTGTTTTTTTTKDGGGDDTSLLGITHVRTTSISIHSVYWPVSNQDNVHAQNIHNQNQKNTMIGSNINPPSINSWIILCIIVFLIFVVFFTIVFAIMYCIRYLNNRLNKQISYTSDMMTNGLHHHEQQPLQKTHLTPDFSTYKPSINMDTSSRILSPYSFNCMELNKANQLFHYTNFHPMCNSCFSLKRHAVTQPVSPADSGLEDSTPLTLQQTRHIFPSIDRRSIRSSRRSRHQHQHHHNHRPFLDTKFTRCPSTSVSSSLLLLQHSPNHHIREMSYGWPIPINLSSNRVNAATSTDDVSIGPASTSVDTGEDACSSTPSDKAIIVNLCQESMQQNTTTATITTTNNNSNDNNNNSNNNND